MKVVVFSLECVMLGLAAVLTAGCGGGAPPRVVPQAIASDAPQKALELYDANKDGTIEGAELDKVPGLKAALKSIDTNGDGKISAEEIAAQIQKWQESKIGRLPVPTKITRRGTPLAGATVTLEPESFLGTELKPGTGVTDQFGMATMTNENAGSASGLSPGFYRVKVTKPGDNIPAKYNTATELGTEVPQSERQRAFGAGNNGFDLAY